MIEYFGRVLLDGRPHFATCVRDKVGLLTGSFLAETLPPVATWCPLDQVKILPPVMPRVVLAVGRNYRAHAAEFGNEVPAEPLFFLKQPGTVVADGDPVYLPSGMGRIDFEGELVVVIGRPAFRLSGPEEAQAAIFGYTIGNDITARELQKQDGQWTRAKGFETFGPIGPWIAQGLESQKLRLRTTVNQVVHQDGNTGDMIFSPADLVYRASQFMAFKPGDLLFTGTPEGVGPVKPQDLVQISIDGIGTLSNLMIGED